MQPKAERGYVIPAFNTDDVDYERCAQQLKESILDFHPAANITILTNKDIPVDLGGFANDWYAYKLSPYRQTIKLEADMIACSAIDHWWTMLEHRDVVISTGCRDFYDQVGDNTRYRKAFINNNLPDVYNAVTYWRLSSTAKEFFTLTKTIFEHWPRFVKLLKFVDEPPSTDLVYAIAAQIIGPELVTMPFASYPRIVHMKRGVIPIKGTDWTQELVWETDPIRIQTVAQWGLLHYHNKQWKI